MFHPRKFYNVTYWVYAVFPGHFNVTRLWCRRKPGKYRFWTKIPIALPWILIKGDGDYIIHNIGCLVTIINFISPLYCWKKVQTLKAEPFLWLVLALYRSTRNADCVWSLYSLDYLLLQVCSLFFIILSFYIRKKILWWISTRMCMSLISPRPQLGWYNSVTKGTCNLKNRKKLFLLLPILLETMNWTCEQQIIIFIWETCFCRRLQIHVYKQNAIFFILQNIFV